MPYCIRKVAKNHTAASCELCNSWVHIKCNKLSVQDYKLFEQNPNLNFTCLKCNELFPYMSLKTINSQHTPFNKITFVEDLDISLEPSPEQQIL